MPFVVERIRRTEIGPGTSDTTPEVREQPHFTRSGGDQMKRVDGAALTDAVYAADALLDSHRIPRELEADDEAAVMMEIEALCGRVGRQQQPARIAREGGEHRRSLVATQS